MPTKYKHYLAKLAKYSQETLDPSKPLYIYERYETEQNVKCFMISSLTSNNGVC